MIRDLTKIFNKRFIYRDAGTGEFVSRAYALLHPGTTFASPRKLRIDPMEEDF